MGSHVFVTYLVRSFDHLGKLLATCGIDLVFDRYVTEANDLTGNSIAVNGERCCGQGSGQEAQKR
jgi:hypothetical protein